MINKRTILIVSIGAMLLAGLIFGFMPAAVLVDSAAVARGPLEVVVAEEGETRLVRRYRIDAPVGGTVSRIDLEVGDRLAAGEMLVTIEPGSSPLLDPRRQAEAEAALARAVAAEGRMGRELDAARSAASIRAIDLKRIRELYEKGDASQSSLEEADSESRRVNALMGAAEFAVQVATHERRSAEAVLQAGRVDGSSAVSVTAPIEGRVLKVHRESRGLVMPAEPLIEIGDIGSLEVQVDVLSSDAVRIVEGMGVRFKRWGGEVPLDGRVTRVEPVGFTKISALGVEEQRVLVICEITSPVEIWQRLGDGYRVEAEFILWSESDVLMVPESSLYRVDGGWAVFVIEDDVARQRTVTPGRRSGLQAQVLSGLEVGELVILHPGDEVGEGVRLDWQR